MCVYVCVCVCVCARARACVYEWTRAQEAIQRYTKDNEEDKEAPAERTEGEWVG